MGRVGIDKKDRQILKERNMKKGDTIKCNGAEDTIQTMHDLAAEGIETDFYYVDGKLYGLEVLEAENNE